MTYTLDKVETARNEAAAEVLMEAISLREAHTKNYADFHKLFELVDAYNAANDEYQDARKCR